jgi:hypothetical protein
MGETGKYQYGENRGNGEWVKREKRFDCLLSNAKSGVMLVLLILSSERVFVAACCRVREWMLPSLAKLSSGDRHKETSGLCGRISDWKGIMSEEQGAFKVTDRRLFNPDGSPRDIIREEEAPAAVAPTAEPVSQASAPAPTSSAPEPVEATTQTSAGANSAEVSEEPTNADDPTSFVNFLMSIASNAAAALGMMEHPATGQRGVDLPLGKHWIDVLGMLQKKTRGNLNHEEEEIFEGILSDLRMQFVSLNSPAAKGAPRGYTANDILGGK